MIETRRRIITDYSPYMHCYYDKWGKYTLSKNHQRLVYGVYPYIPRNTPLCTFSTLHYLLLSYSLT